MRFQRFTRNDIELIACLRDGGGLFQHNRRKAAVQVFELGVDRHACSIHACGIAEPRVAARLRRRVLVGCGPVSAMDRDRQPEILLLVKQRRTLTPAGFQK